MADSVESDIRDDRPRGLLEAYEDGGVTGRIAYFVLDGERAALVAVHTVVEPRHEGRGIAGALVRRFYAIAADEGLPVVPLCPYAAAWVGRHPEEAPVPPAALVAEARRQLKERPERW
ncbi:N-acetyltransferase [Streptomyces clavuligerus]|uniref:GNAT family N-acetyltransferase n=1 Tax=Streptomyces clavuligerus TaxID=1901 RepID=UPI000810B519|nr:GNAT family N-acetyltransferase [Streptomyces clavuligerus]ANW17070.1 acetyltransferase [Streptomyces clavuligerus]AXU11606.1 N-acetyltransferase [Streptomyces clavuligerus]MBY6301432.1 N-acetyltransferase [Streptomyces clavuligerus]QPL61725.1 N-acetyltransferase [Streptomyces clavuligerus]QPL67757.1 N-acetyltransferase [Streptomyces clavuligerus]